MIHWLRTLQLKQFTHILIQFLHYKLVFFIQYNPGTFYTFWVIHYTITSTYLCSDCDLTSNIFFCSRFVLVVLIYTSLQYTLQWLRLEVGVQKNKGNQLDPYSNKQKCSQTNERGIWSIKNHQNSNTSLIRLH